LPRSTHDFPESCAHHLRNSGLGEDLDLTVIFGNGGDAPHPHGDSLILVAVAGGFFDADLDIELAGGADGAWQIPILDCTVA
jgi:hypothetical protein